MKVEDFKPGSKVRVIVRLNDGEFKKNAIFDVVGPSGPAGCIDVKIKGGTQPVHINNIEPYVQHRPKSGDLVRVIKPDRTCYVENDDILILDHYDGKTYHIEAAMCITYNDNLVGIDAQSIESIEPKIAIDDLTSLVCKYNHEYHVFDKVSITDSDYDKKFKTLRWLENKYPEFKHFNSPTTPVKIRKTSSAGYSDTIFKKAVQCGYSELKTDIVQLKNRMNDIVKQLRNAQSKWSHDELKQDSWYSLLHNKLYLLEKEYQQLLLQPELKAYKQTTLERITKRFADNGDKKAVERQKQIDHVFNGGDENDYRDISERERKFYSDKLSDPAEDIKTFPAQALIAYDNHKTKL